MAPAEDKPFKSGNPNFHFGGDVEEESDEEPADQTSTTINPDNDGANNGQEDKEDDLENAFQMLDMARAILEKMTGQEALLKLASVHNALGEVATESGKLYVRLVSPLVDNWTQRNLPTRRMNI